MHEETILDLSRQFFISYPFLIAIVSFLIGMIFMPYVLRLAIRKQMVVRPNKRTSHNGDIPNVGGINIFSSFILAYFLLTASGVDGVKHYILAGLYFIFIVGFFDDLMTFSAKKKLIGELIAGFMLIVIADVRLTNMQGFLGLGEIGYIFSYLVSFFLFLLIINSLNLIDGVDGLATGIGIIISCFYGVYFMLVGNGLNSLEFSDLSIMAFALIGSLAIFFRYNVFGRKNKIFMGDSGSLVMGYIIYILVINFLEINRIGYPAQPLNGEFYMRSSPAMSVAILAVPLLDTLRVMITRIKNGNSPFKPDKNHMHHLLLSIGLKHRQVTYILCSVNISFIAVAIIGNSWKNSILVIVTLVMAILYTLLLWRVVDKHKRKQN